MRAYLQLMKLRIVELLLVATVPTMIFAHHYHGNGGFPSIWLILVTLVGGTLSAGAAGAFNSYIDRESDRLMKRTSKRPLVTRVVNDWEALALGWVLSVASVLLSCAARFSSWRPTPRPNSSTGRGCTGSAVSPSGWVILLPW